jgi:hypothetical protein
LTWRKLEGKEIPYPKDENEKLDELVKCIGDAHNDILKDY